MHTPVTEVRMHERPEAETEIRTQGVGTAARQVSEHASALVRLELELASLELKRKLAALGVGIGLGVGAAVLALYGLGFLFATLAAALDSFMPRWLALLIVAILLFALAGLLGKLGLGRVKRGSPPIPKQAIEEAKRTSEALKRDGTTP